MNEKAILDAYLDGYTVNDIVEASWSNRESDKFGRDLDFVMIDQLVTSETIRQLFSNDPRYIHRFHSHWIASSSGVNLITGNRDPFVVIFHNRENIEPASAKVLEAIKSDLNRANPSVKLDTTIVESMLNHHALKYVHDHSFLAWVVHDDETVTQYKGQYQKLV